jgi:hypothetical protein
MSTEGKYIYCIINGKVEKDFDPVGIGGREDRVHTVVFEDIAAVVSNSPIVQYPISRENTLAHMKVMEMFMEDYAILPVKFGTIAEGNERRSPQERIKLEILKARYKELNDLLARMSNKIELGLKAIWLDMEAIFNEIAGENKDIEILKNRISTGNPSRAYSQRIKLGEMVKKALDDKRAMEELKILNMLNGAYHALRQNKIFGDNMITNSAFLVDRNRMQEFDKLIDKLFSIYEGRTKFKYVGPSPPCNFVDLVITMRGGKDERGKEGHYRI